MDNVVDILESRGLVDNVTAPEIRDFVSEARVVYAGFDPSSDCLQVGNLVAIIGLRHFQRCGHPVIALAGGATGRIGDPSGKTSERDLISEEAIEANLEGIAENLSRLLDFEDDAAPVRILNNNDWMGSFPFISFLRDVGKHFRMGSMLGKESVRTRIDSDEGMSFAEFSYQILQAYDFLHLFDTTGCRLQIGGSDQWGNITAGTDLVHKLRGESVFGLTIPLITDNAGQKFGKSEGNAVYLNADRTSYYDFYQFFIRVEDADVERFLKVFTFLSLEEIAEITATSAAAPEKRIGQRSLAEEVTRMVHGDEGLRIAQQASSVLFGGSLEDLSADDLATIFADVASTDLPRAEVEGMNAIDLAAATGLCKSKGEARRLVANGGLYINNERVAGVDVTVRADMLIDGRMLLLRSGKRNFHLARVN